MWPGIPCNMVALFQGQNKEGEKQGKRKRLRRRGREGGAEGGGREGEEEEVNLPFGQILEEQWGTEILLWTFYKIYSAVNLFIQSRLSQNILNFNFFFLFLPVDMDLGE